jgi:hypothetical protein
MVCDSRLGEELDRAASSLIRNARPGASESIASTK